MSKTDTMARLPGLFQRAGVWTLCMKIPLDPSGGLPGALEDHRVTPDDGPRRSQGQVNRPTTPPEATPQRPVLVTSIEAKSVSVDGTLEGLDATDWDGTLAPWD